MIILRKQFSGLVYQNLEPNNNIYAVNRNARFNKALDKFRDEQTPENAGKLVAQTVWDQTVGKAIYGK